LEIATAAAVVAAWAVLYLVVVTTAPLAYDPATESAAKVNREFALLLTIPAALWVTAVLTLVGHWWSRTGIRLFAMDPPGRLLAAALRLPSLGSWPVLALTSGVAAVAVVAAGLAVGAAVPGLAAFAVGFVGLVGAMGVLAVARLRRLRLLVPLPALLVIGGVASAIIMTVIFLHRDPAAARYLPPADAVFLAAVLAGCLWIAVAAPRSPGGNQLAPHLGVAAALVLVVGQLLLIRASYDPDIVPAGRQVLDALGGLWFWFGPAAVFFVPAFAAGWVGRSFRSGLQAGIWAGIASLPLTYAVWLHEALRLYAIDGGLLWFGDGAPEGENLRVGAGGPGGRPGG
jgi:hypothetical protein